MFGSAIENEESKLAIIDPFTNEQTQDAKKDEDEYVAVDFESLLLSRNYLNAATGLQDS